MSEPGHSSLPWSFAFDHPTHPDIVHIYSANREEIAGMYPAMFKGDPELIVRAVNAYADFVEALRKIRDMPVGELRPLTAEIEIWNIARKALAKAGVE